MIEAYPELRDLSAACVANFDKLPPEVQEKAEPIRAIHRDHDAMMNEIGRLEVKHGVEVDNWRSVTTRRLTRLRKNNFQITEHPPLKLQSHDDDGWGVVWSVVEGSDGQG